MYSPWAYDRLQVAPGAEGRIRVAPEPGERMFTLADVIASSGAAPQLSLLLGDSVLTRLRAPLRTAAEAFPAFTNLAIRNNTPLPPSAELPHGDGGFTDNLGVMPLLARQLENFPYYATFGQNRPRTIQLNALQVNLLADLAAWSITNSDTVNAVIGAFGEDVLPRPNAGGD